MSRVWVGVIFISIAGLGVGCGPAPETNDNPRTTVEAFPLRREGDMPVLRDELRDDFGVEACEYWISQSGSSDTGVFRLIREAKMKRGELLLSMDPAAFPLFQIKVGEGVPDGDEEKFWEEVVRQYQSGKIGFIKYNSAKSLRAVGKLKWLMPGKINDSIREAFPGVFDGNVEEAAGSLIRNLVHKMGLEDKNLVEAGYTLSKEIPLLGLNSSDEVRKALAAARRGFNSNNPSEKLCALGLWHRAFGGLLSLKGYRKPVLAMKGDLAFLPELEGSRPVFLRENHFGAYVDRKTLKPLILTSDQISQYDPQGDLSLVAEKGLDQELEVMLYSSHILRATSPTELKEGEAYLLGDILQEKGHAILPFEAHSLALGFLTMGFKNLSEFSIVKVNARGQRLQENEKPAGIVIVGDQTESAPAGPYEVSLDQVAALMEIVVRTSAWLDEFGGFGGLNEGRDWSKTHPVYTPETLQRLKGLRSSLEALKMPLALLGLSLWDQRVAVMEWDLATGAQRVVKQVSIVEELRFREALRLLALDTQSSILLERAF